MKSNLIYKLVLALTFFVIGSCVNKEQVPRRDCTIHAAFDGKDTKVSLEQADNLSLTSKWSSDDSFDIFVNGQDARTDVPIGEISEDGKNCTFIINLTDAENMGTSQLFCATDPAHATIVDGRIFCNASLVRSPLSRFSAPVYASAEITDWDDVSVRFKHYLVYEVIHVRNEAEHLIQFTHCGFESEDDLWYHTTGAVAMDDGSFIVDNKAAEAPVMTGTAVIHAGTNGVIISAYRANGNKISKAKMVAEVDGKSVLTTNTRSSDLDLQFGHAYHMYVVWDGAALHFRNAADGSEVDAAGLGYGSVGTGDVAGSGLGYGSDTSGDVTGDGAGYGTDGSGSISGSGSGYSKGN